ncbi:MAG TPA: phosphate ABC transporter substrate-binding protein PstS [Nocardioides sp.]|uniref:phosphate ABC transporter substrate-binding protein PstS n=1 Tax=Nocardioides sp. TaxID=35761 RepID=UPI002E336372|nr:phosphate ABC transporter substrate-binding protein PstS [Nocardioides sp.]HEX5089351.1 phosphate ABC transporter substrate-binding protein PstS [Nocardioides sp.]
MKSTLVSGRNLRRGVVPVVAALALALTACGDDSDSANTSASGGGGSGGDVSGLSGTLNGGGSSAQQSAQAAWTAGFQGQASGVTVNYDPVGSGTGRTNFLSKAYHFAGSDSALSDDDSAGPSEVDQAKERCGGEAAIEVPVYVSPIAVVFNVSGVDSLDLDPATLAHIFQGDITTWNDPAIASLNDGVDLPDTAITPVHRSDDSGTTANFTDYLSKTSDGAWTAAPDDTWPTSTGEKAQGTSGVVSAVKGGDGTIGYADFSQTAGMSTVAIKVGDSFNQPSAEGAADVLAGSPPPEGRDPVDMAISVDRTIDDANAYPLLLASYEIACQHYDDANTAALVKGYLSYMVSDEGQQAAAAQAGSAPLDSELAARAQDIVSKISGS